MASFEFGLFNVLKDGRETFMKKLFALAVFLISSTSFAFVPTHTSHHGDVHYKGKGFWKKADGMHGTYSVEQTFRKDKSVHLKYVFSGEGQEMVKEYEFTWAWDNADAKHKTFFSLYNGEEKFGSGYCMGTACHYEMTVAMDGDPMQIEETLNFAHHGRVMKRMGSKGMGENKEVWGEVLHAHFCKGKKHRDHCDHEEEEEEREEGRR